MKSPDTTILVIGGGAREHALAWRLQVGAGTQPIAGRRVVVAPGNPGIVAAAVALARELHADLVVVGPEQPLVDGVIDALDAAGIAALGPTAACARLEGSKAFMKEVCTAAHVDTAGYAVCTRSEQAEAFIASRPGGAVVKADGLCAGKGVTVCPNPSDARDEARAFLEGRFGAASKTIVVEDLLPGEELSVFGLCDGVRALLFAPARDHKRLLDDDRGPNTGGMGAVVPLGARHGVPDAMLDDVDAQVFQPILRELARRGTPYRGILYAGLMLKDGHASVLEFNVRLGDPEAEALLLGTKVDLLPLFLGVARKAPLPSDAPAVRTLCAPAAVVVIASPGYPESPELGATIEGLERDAATSGSSTEEARVFCAGVGARGDALVTAGGRVLACTATGPTFEEALSRAYALVDRVRFPGMQARRDIGASVRGQ